MGTLNAFCWVIAAMVGISMFAYFDFSLDKVNDQISQLNQENDALQAKLESTQLRLDSVSQEFMVSESMLKNELNYDWRLSVKSVNFWNVV